MIRTFEQIGRVRLIIATIGLCSSVLVCLGLVALAHVGSDLAASLTERLFVWVLVWIVIVCPFCLIMLASQPRRLAVRMAAGALTLGAIILLLEIAAILRLVHWPLAFQKFAGDGTEFMWAYRHDSELSFRRRPLDHWIGKPASDIERGSSMPSSLDEPISFTYDQWGYRNSVKHTEAEVVLIGDSYVEGAHVSDHQTVARKLEERINTTVKNLGIAGYGAKQESIVLEKDALEFSPSTVVWFFFEGNDLYDDQTFENSFSDEEVAMGDHREGMARHDSWNKRSFIYALVSRLRLWAQPIVPSRPPYAGLLQIPGYADRVVYFADYAGVPWDEWIRERWQITRTTLQLVASVADKNEIELILVYVPIKYRVFAPFVEFDDASPANNWTLWPLEEKFMSFCRGLEIGCLSLTEEFRNELLKGGMPYWPTDTHWSPAGHELVARLLALRLVSPGDEALHKD